MGSLRIPQWTNKSLFAICILVSSAVLVCPCTVSDLDNCWEPMTNLPDHLTWEVIVPTLTEESMREHCRLYNEVEDCLQTLSCDSLQQGVHEGLENAYHFLCEEAFDDYLTYRSCFNDTRLHEEGKYCNHTLVTKLDSLDSSDTTQYKLQRVCQYANDYLDCVENAVQSFCGARAASWQRELDYRSLTPLLSRTGCMLDSNNRVYYPVPPETVTEDKTKTYIIIGCVVGLSVIVILILIALFIMLRNKKKAANQRRSTPSHRVDMDYLAAPYGMDLPPGASAVHAGPLPIKEPPPYNEAPPEYTPYEKARTGGSIVGRSSNSGGHSVVNGDARSDYIHSNGRAPSTKAGSVYSEGSRRSRGHSDYHTGQSSRSSHSKAAVQDDYF